VGGLPGGVPRQCDGPAKGRRAPLPGRARARGRAKGRVRPGRRGLFGGDAPLPLPQPRGLCRRQRKEHVYHVLLLGQAHQDRSQQGRSGDFQRRLHQQALRHRLLQRPARGRRLWRGHGVRHEHRVQDAQQVRLAGQRGGELPRSPGGLLRSQGLHLRGRLGEPPRAEVRSRRPFHPELRAAGRIRGASSTSPPTSRWRATPST